MKIELRGVVKTFKRLRALDHVSFEIMPGQIVALLGSNGAGKTTLLRCLAGIVSPDAGAVLFDDEPFDRSQMERRKRFFFLPDFPLVFESWSVIRHIGMTLRLYGVKGPGIEERVLELLRDFDLLALAEMPFQTLSRGQRYKAALAMMLAADPEVWLLDEPFSSGMDPHGISAFKQQTRAAVARGRTVIYSTQILEVVERFSDQVCVIHKGEVRAFDSLVRLQANAREGSGALEQLFQQLRAEEAA